ncbi:MAG: hypothetical protein AABY64_04975, partial [Bdellovibrionota bacterium]
KIKKLLASSAGSIDGLAYTFAFPCKRIGQTSCLSFFGRGRILKIENKKEKELGFCPSSF